MLYILIFCAGVVAYGIYEDIKAAREYNRKLKEIENKLCKMLDML